MICISESELYKNENLIVDPKRYYTVYYHQNKINGKMYIGMTSKPVNVRWGKNGNGYWGQVFYKAILKYGWHDGFYHEIFASNLTKEEAENIERTLISKFQTYLPQYGYNRAAGGSGGHMRGSACYQYDSDGNFVKYWDDLNEAARQLKISPSNITKVCRGEKKSIGRFIFRYEPDDNIQPKHITSKEHEVLQFDRVGNFISKHKNAYEGSRTCNGKSPDIISCCDGTRISYRGFYWFYADRFSQDKLEQLVKEYKSSPKYQYEHYMSEQYSLDGQYIRTYQNFFELQNERSLKDFQLRNVLLCCRGEKEFSMQSKWKMIENNA